MLCPQRFLPFVVKCLETLLLAYWTHVSHVKPGLPSVQMKATNVAFLLTVNPYRTNVKNRVSS